MSGKDPRITPGEKINHGLKPAPQTPRPPKPPSQNNKKK